MLVVERPLRLKQLTILVRSDNAGSWFRHNWFAHVIDKLSSAFVDAPYGSPNSITIVGFEELALIPPTTRPLMTAEEIDQYSENVARTCSSLVRTMSGQN